MRGIHFREMFPFLREIIERKNRRNGAYWDTCAAIDTLDWINIQLFGGPELRLTFSWMDAVHWTCIYTSSVHGANTWFRNHVSHKALSCMETRAKGMNGQ